MSGSRMALWRVDQGDCRELMAAMPEASVDAVLTDPPYELGFMGKSWDASGVAYSRGTWDRALRLLKPGGHLLAFSGTRTSHRMVSAIEDAGFEIRDSLVWLYGSGFPKSKTALKPAHEPICLARKPLRGSVTANAAAHGTGALNIDGCRIGYVDDADMRAETRGVHSSATDYDGLGEDGGAFGGLPTGRVIAPANPAGRWPANVVLDEEAGTLLDAQTGILHSQDPATRLSRSKATGVTEFGTGASVEYGDRGGASRFFYCAKAATAERNAGLEGFPTSLIGTWGGEDDDLTHGKKPTIARANPHPTVKPLDLMRWLVRLVTPTGGTVLDPFTGSGTTGCAAVLEGFRFIGLEMDPQYVEIARARIAYWEPQGWQEGLPLGDAA